MRARLVVFRIFFCLAAASLAACGGGGGGGAAALPPVQPQGTVSSAGSAAAVAVSIAIAVPAASTSSLRRRTRYVSAGTRSATVRYGNSAQTTNCASTCSLVLNVNPGSVTFEIDLYDGSNGSGNLLSTGKTTTTIAAGENNSVKVTFGAVVSSIVLVLGTGAVTVGTPASVPLTVTAKDAAGYTIVGSDPYATPIALSSDDTSGATSLSASSAGSPGAAVSVTYNGSASTSAAHISASVPGTGVAAAPVTLAVQNPPASVPAHITTWYFYGINGINASIPAGFMASHADYAEDDSGYSAGQLEAFKAAGGKYGVSYSDPAFSVYCYTPFAPPAGHCEGPMGGLLTNDESAWLHGADGGRVNRYVDAHYQYQEALNPAAASVHSAYRSSTASDVAKTPHVDYFFADDSGDVWNGSDGTPLTGHLYRFNAAATEITADAAFIAGEQQTFAAAAKPVFINGATPYTLMPSYDGTFLKSPNVVGQNFESCYGESGGVLTDDSSSGPRWSNISNALLAVFRYGTKAVCMNNAPATTTNRLYVLASWWLTYDENRSIIAPTEKTSDGFTVLPEFDIVPRLPRATAVTSVASLRAPGGAYVREFAACYQAGKAIGPCAAAVNPGAAPVPMPSFAGHYTAALSVDDRSAYTGGTASWTGAVPAQLAAHGAVLLR